MPRREELGDTPFSYVPPSQTQPQQAQQQPLFVDLDVIMQQPELAAAYGSHVYPTTVPLDLDVIMQAGTQVKTREDLPWFQTVASRYGEKIPAYAVIIKQPKQPWTEGGSVTGKVYTGTWKGLLPEFFPKVFPEDIFKQHVIMSPQFASMREFSAGFIAVPESWIRPEVPTPMGAVVGKLFGQTSAYETGEVSPFYTLGGVAGTVVESYAMGKAASYVYRGIKAITPKFVKEAVYSAKESVRFSRAVKALTEAKWAVQRNVPYWKLTEPFKKVVAPQEITELSIKGFKQVGLKELEMVEASWLIRMAPKTGGVWISRAGEMVTTREGFKVLSKVGGYWALREVMHTPLISQTLVTRMGIHPYVPRMVTTTQATGKIVQNLIGPAISTIPKVLQLTKPKPLQRETLIPVPKMWQPTFTQEREKLRPQELLRTEPRVKQREDLMPVLKITPSLRTKQPPTQILPPTFKIPPFTPPTIPLTPFFPKLDLGGGSGGGGGSRSLFGRWYRKQQLIKTPREMMRTFFGAPSRKRRRKR